MNAAPNHVPTASSITSDARIGARRVLLLTAPITVIAAVTSTLGLTDAALYRGTLVWTAQAVAQDFADLVLVLPLLVVSAWFAARGSRRGWLVWLGALSYLVYTFVIYAFAVHHNRLFLAYVAVLGGTLWALVIGLWCTDWDDIQSRFAARAPVRPIGVLLIAAAVLFCLLWLADEVPAALSGAVPQSIVDAGVMTNPVHVIDLAVMLPAMAMAGRLAWRRRAMGYGLAVVLLVNVVLQDAAITTMMVYARRAGLPSSAAMIGVFAALGGATLAALVWYLRSMAADDDAQRRADVMTTS